MCQGRVVELDGFVLWACCAESPEGYRLRLSLDDWRSLGLTTGRRVSLRLGNGGEEWLFVTHITELHPFAWVALTGRLRAAG